jgi:hypothetical protein
MRLRRNRLMETIDQRKLNLVPLFEQGIKELSPEKYYKIQPVVGGWHWNIVDPGTSAVVGSFKLDAERVANLKGSLDDYVRSVLRNALMRVTAFPR